MAKMSTFAINKHKKNPNVLLKLGGVNFKCKCGSKLFHHVDDNEEYHCNKCKCVYDISEDIFKE
jgi:hypothetical protein